MQEMQHVRYYFGPGLENLDEHGRQPGSKQPSREGSNESVNLDPRLPSGFLSSGSLERWSSTGRLSRGIPLKFLNSGFLARLSCLGFASDDQSARVVAEFGMTMRFSASSLTGWLGVGATAGFPSLLVLCS